MTDINRVAQHQTPARTIPSQGQDLAPHPTQSRTHCSQMSFSGRAPAPWSALWPAACARLESLSWCWRWRPAGCLVEKGRIQLLQAYVDGHVVHELGVRAVEHRLGTHDMALCPAAAYARCSSRQWTCPPALRGHSPAPHAHARPPRPLPPPPLGGGARRD